MKIQKRREVEEEETTPVVGIMTTYRGQVGASLNDLASLDLALPESVALYYQRWFFLLERQNHDVAHHEQPMSETSPRPRQRCGTK